MLRNDSQRFATLRNDSQRFATIRNASQRFAMLCATLRNVARNDSQRFATLHNASQHFAMYTTPHSKAVKIPVEVFVETTLEIPGWDTVRMPLIFNDSSI